MNLPPLLRECETSEGSWGRPEWDERDGHGGSGTLLGAAGLTPGPRSRVVCSLLPDRRRCSMRASALGPCLLLTLVVLSLGEMTTGSAPPPATKTTPPLQTYWEDVFHRALDHAAAGYAYAIYHRGQPVAVGAHGYARVPGGDDDPGIPMTTDTRIQLASCSKPITAVALLHELEHQGKSASARMWPLIDHLFETAGDGVEAITIEQLLTHRTGYEFGYIETPRMENASTLLAKPVPHPSGEKRRYSNINTSLARIVLEAISGRDYEDYVREEILRPAGADGMKLKVREDEVAVSYAYNDLSVGKPIVDDFTDDAAAYGWYGTANEVARLLRRIRTSEYLSEESTTAMFERGLGWSKRDLHACPAYGHDGQWVLNGNLGVRTGVMVLPDEVEAVLLINTNGPFLSATYPGRRVRTGLPPRDPLHRSGGRPGLDLGRPTPRCRRGALDGRRGRSHRRVPAGRWAGHRGRARDVQGPRVRRRQAGDLRDHS